MASVELSRRVGKVVGYPPLSEMGDLQRQAIHEGALEHDGGPVLRFHVIHAAAKTGGEEWRFFEGGSKRPIDALICTMMGLSSALQAPATGGFEW
jgi:hypothetical protein